MIKKLPIIRPQISLKDLVLSLKASAKKSAQPDFKSVLAEFCGRRNAYLTNSGIAAFYLGLQALKNQSDKKEVILPAYTAGSLVVAVRKAGLKPVLCDISLQDFNADIKDILNVISEQTLAVVAVHMFGIPIADIAEWRNKIPAQTWLIEDCCQAMGAMVNDTAVGRFGDLSFYSFNRGKNFTLLSGGGITSTNEELAWQINLDLQLLPEEEIKGLAFKIFASLIATNPYVYGLGHGFIARFKENAPPQDFAVAKLSRAQAELGAYLLAQSNPNFLARYRNGTFLLNGLKETTGIRLPKISFHVFAVFNRLPIIFEETEYLKHKEKALWNAGIETSRMYIQPLHRMFDLGYRRAEFANANYLAEHLLTLPVYPGLKPRDLERMIEVIRK
jgi:perosamine synthetase